MTSSTQRVSVESLCIHVSSGGTPSRKIQEYWEDGNIPWIKTGELRDSKLFDAEEKITKAGLENSSAKIFPVNTVLMAMYGDGKTITSLGILKEELATNQACCAMIANPERCDYRFLYYSLMQNRRRLLGLVVAGAQRNLSIGIIKKFQIDFFPLNIQNQIGDTLSAYDDLIENNKRRIELLEESARQLYKEWFVRFRFPGHEHVKIVGGMPEGWESCPASDALHINPRVSVEKGKEIVCVPMASLSESQMTVDKSAFEQRTNHTSVKFMRGDTLFARITPCLENGKTTFVYFLEEGEIACGSTEFVVLRGKKVSNQFTYLLAREESFRGNAIKSMIGSSGRQRVQPSCFDKYIVPIPPDYIQEQFDNIVFSAFEQIAVLAKQSEQLARARDILLPKLMSGEVAV